MFYPEWVFELWAEGAADEICAADMDLPISKQQRLFWHVRGSAFCFLFGWWWWVKDNHTPRH
jgi:hypothetical protein